MIAILNNLCELDNQLLLALNGAHCPYADSLMWLLAGKLSWIPMIAVLLWVMWRRGWKQALLMLAALALTIVLADQLASGLIKPLVHRLRPSHDPAIMNSLHLLNGYRGGMYGFVSSHAANAFGSAVLVALMMRHRAVTWALLAWASAVSYSRIYEGVHFPGDVVCGAAIGAIAAWAVAMLYWRLCRSRLRLHDSRVPGWDAKVFSLSVAFNLLILIVVAFFYKIG